MCTQSQVADSAELLAHDFVEISCRTTTKRQLYVPCMAFLEQEGIVQGGGGSTGCKGARVEGVQTVGFGRGARKDDQTGGCMFPNNTHGRC